jgi:hypothetical protein
MEPFGFSWIGSPFKNRGHYTLAIFEFVVIGLTIKNSNHIFLTTLAREREEMSARAKHVPKSLLML